MDFDQQVRCAGLIAKKLTKMANIKFPAYGSLYFARTPYLPPSKLPFNEEFVSAHAVGTCTGIVCLLSPNSITMSNQIKDLG